MNDARFPKTRRVLKQSEFDAVFERRRSSGDGLMTLYAGENGLEFARLGLVVSRKCGNAVARNRWKRSLREAFRRVQHELPPGLDLVVIPRPEAVPTASRWERSLCQLAERVSRALRRDVNPPRADP